MPTQEELEAAHAWEADDRVGGRPEMTEFRRRLRHHQSKWRESNGHPIGTQPIAPHPGQRSRPLGSRLPLDYARETGANFVTKGALAAVTARTSFVEPNQSVDHQRLWADLLWSPSIAFNLFGDLASDLAAADRAVHARWPEVPGTVSAVRFVHSPGWLDPAYLNSLREFDTLFELDSKDGTKAILAVDVKYHERLKPETPRPENLARYQEVARRSRAFRRGAVESLTGRNGLAVMWLEHLLLLSMLQRPGGGWTWGRYVVVHPEGSVDFAEATDRYRGLLADPSSFGSTTLEDLLGAGALRPSTVRALRARYLPR
jgi:hypothetical protein